MNRWRLEIAIKLCTICESDRTKADDIALE